MVAPISLSNMQNMAMMESMLYGGVGMNPNSAAPNYLNGYYGVSNNSYNPYNYNQYGYNQYTNPSVYNQQDYAKPASVNKADFNTLAEYYAENLEPSQSLLAAGAGGALFGMMFHPRLVAHTYNSISTLGEMKKMFADVKVEGKTLNKLWKENNAVMRDAYYNMHRLEARAKSKAGLFRKSYSNEDYKKLKGLMEEALQSGKIDEVAKASAQLNHAYVSDGLIPRGWNKVKNILGFKSEVSSVTSKLADTATIASNAKILLEKPTFLQSLKRSVGGPVGAVFQIGMEALMGIPKIKTAFSKDKETGWKQVGQTTVKGLGNAAGWVAGEALGVWGAAKLGATIGTAFGPGVGTVIGGIAGIVCGSIGCCLAGKLTKKLVGDDVANKVEAENLVKTQEGQAQLLQFAAEKAQSGEKMDKNTQLAFGRLLTQYA